MNQRIDKDDRFYAYIVYTLYAASYFLGGITALVGVAIAHAKRDELDPLMKSHYDYQIKTFWYGLLMLGIGAITTIILIGWLIIAVWFIWTVFRIVKGLIRLSDNLPII